MSKEFALQGGPRPHPPAVARGHRATSPVGANTPVTWPLRGLQRPPPQLSPDPFRRLARTPYGALTQFRAAQRRAVSSPASPCETC